MLYLEIPTLGSGQEYQYSNSTFCQFNCPSRDDTSITIRLNKQTNKQTFQHTHSDRQIPAGEVVHSQPGSTQGTSWVTEQMLYPSRTGLGNEPAGICAIFIYCQSNILDNVAKDAAIGER